MYSDIAEIIETIISSGFEPDALRAKYRAERDKRLRPEGNAQYVEVKAEFSRYMDDPFVSPGFIRDPVTGDVEVAIVGAGFGGLLLGARLRDVGVRRIRLIEVASDVGGTWYWNRYPGAACDIEAYIYLPLLEETGYMPERRFAKGPEIFEHAKRIARHYNLYEGALFQTKVLGAIWDEVRGRWNIETNRGDRISAQFLALANGRLSHPKLPGIPGIDRFQGFTFHTSRWNYDYTGGTSEGSLVKLRDKRVGIIGTGATAIQCVPHLAEWSQHLYVFQRTPSSVDVRDDHPTDPEWAASLRPAWQRERMENFNTLVSGGDAPVDLVGDGWTEIFRNLTGIAAKLVSRDLGRRLSPEEKETLLEVLDFRKMEQIRQRVSREIHDPKVAEALKPWYRQFCKRPCFHDTYLGTFNRNNVTLVDTGGRGVERMTTNSVVVGGVKYPVDCLVFATGFEIGTEFTHRVGYDLVGRDGRRLSDKWTPGMSTLHGLMANSFPNAFFIGFMQTAVTINIPHALDEQSKHVAFIVDRLRARGADAIEATVEGEREWVAEMRRVAKMSEKFYAECTPGYYNNEGQAGNPHSYFANTYGAGPLRFFDILANWRDAGDMPGTVLSTLQRT